MEEKNRISLSALIKEFKFEEIYLPASASEIPRSTAPDLHFQDFLIFLSTTAFSSSALLNIPISLL